MKPLDKVENWYELHEMATYVMELIDSVADEADVHKSEDEKILTPAFQAMEKLEEWMKEMEDEYKENGGDDHDY